MPKWAKTSKLLYITLSASGAHFIGKNSGEDGVTFAFASALITSVEDDLVIYELGLQTSVQ